MKRHTPSRSIWRSGEGKCAIPDIIIGNGPSYGAYPGSSPLIQLPILPSPSATGMMTASVSMRDQNVYPYLRQNNQTANTVPKNPPWKLIPHSHSLTMSIGCSR